MPGKGSKKMAMESRSLAKLNTFSILSNICQILRYTHKFYTSRRLPSKEASTLPVLT